MTVDPSEDPNKDSNDPMEPEYWSQGEDLMEEMRLAGLGGDRLETVAVDIHDILQAVDRMKEALASGAPLRERLVALRTSAWHVRWHANSLGATLRDSLLAD